MRKLLDSSSSQRASINHLYAQDDRRQLREFSYSDLRSDIAFETLQGSGRLTTVTLPAEFTFNPVCARAVHHRLILLCSEKPNGRRAALRAEYLGASSGGHFGGLTDSQFDG